MAERKTHDKQINSFIEVLNNSEQVYYANRFSSFLLEQFNQNIQKENLDFRKFVQNLVIVITNKKELNYLYRKDERSRQSHKSHKLIFHNAILQLLSKGQQKYAVQAKGYSLTANKKVQCDTVNSFNRILIGKHFKRIQGLIGDFHLANLYQYYQLFLYKNNYFIQLCGKKLNSLIISGIKQRVKFKENALMNINRNAIYYCSHMNRQPGLFKGSLMANKKLGIAQIIEILFKRKQYFKDPPFKWDKFKDNYLEKFKSCVERMRYRLRKVNFNRLLAKYLRMPKKYQEMKKVIKKLQRMKIIDKSDQKHQEKLQELYKELFSWNSTYENISKFLQAFLKIIVPKDIFGKYNFQKIMVFVRRFVALKRYETLHYDVLSSEFRIHKIKWLQTKKFSWIHPSKKRQTAKFFFQQVLKVIVEEYILQLLQHNFYITDIHGGGSKTYYYRKPIWKLVSTLTTHSLQLHDHFEKLDISKKDIKKYEDDLPYPMPKLRIVPKNKTYRPIMTFNRKQKKNFHYFTQQQGKSLNKSLHETAIILRHVRKCLIKEGNFGVFQNSEIMSKIEEFKHKWINKQRPKLYFFTFDIKKCYDSVDLKKLTEFIKDTHMLEELFILASYESVYRNKVPFKNKSQKSQLGCFFNSKKRKVAVPLNRIMDIAQFYEENKNKSELIVIIDDCERKVISKKHIIEKLDILNNIVMKYNNMIFKQIKGIPQGLNVSNVLSSFYYSQLENLHIKSKMKWYQNDNVSILMRLTDDYLFLGNNKQQAIDLIKGLKIMASSSNFRLNDDKFQCNFTDPDLDITIPAYKIQILDKLPEQQQYFQWIGKLVDLKNVEIKPAINLDVQSISNSINVYINYTGKGLEFLLKNKFKSLLMNNSLFFFTDAINSTKTNKEILEKFTEVSMKKILQYFEYIRLNMHKNIHPRPFQMMLFHSIRISLDNYVRFLNKNTKQFNLKQLKIIVTKVVLDQLKRYQVNYYYLMKALKLWCAPLFKNSIEEEKMNGMNGH